VYPYGTQEQYPQVTDSDNKVLDNTAHQYYECSNKGICDRATGTCGCFDGYDGSACQRASCPTTSSGVCSGHGTCETIKTIAGWDNGNVYSLWDEYSTMGCVCDGGYSGADCSEKICKYGADPLYYDDQANIRYSNFTVQIYTVTDKTVVVTGNYSIIFTDHYGEDWETGPIDNKANCKAVIAALEALPNNVIPSGTLRCFNPAYLYSGFEDDNLVDTELLENSGLDQSQVGGANKDLIIHNRYILSFPGNIGRLAPIRINKYLDGSRPTMFSDELVSTLGWHIYPNGFAGEDDDLVSDLCEGIFVSVDSSTATSGYHKLVVGEGQDTKAVKKCLGDADGFVGNNVDVYDWDYGTDENPHLIKLIDASQYQYITGYAANTQADAAASKVPLGLGNPNVFKNFNAGVPYTQLCHHSSEYETDVWFDRDLDPDAHVAFGRGWCENKDPSGFYAVVKYDGTDFLIYTRAGADFDSNTKFWLYTTKGTVQIVNTETKVFNIATSTSTQEQVAGIHSNLVYVTNSSAALSPSNGDDIPFSGQIDCETIDPLSDPTTRGIRIAHPTSYIADEENAGDSEGVDNYVDKIGVRTCLDKDDYVLIFNNDLSEAGLNSNPSYPNIYTVKKIFRDQNVAPQGDDVTIANNLWRRNKIVLDYGLNAQYVNDEENTPTLLGGSIYKFIPAPEGPYNYVGECSNRGICDSATGICQCFPGYTTDNCGAQNALAQ